LNFNTLLNVFFCRSITGRFTGETIEFVLKNPGSPIGPGLGLQDIIRMDIFGWSGSGPVLFKDLGGKVVSNWQGKVSLSKMFYNVGRHYKAVPTASIPGIHPEAYANVIKPGMSSQIQALRPKYVTHERLNLKELCKEINNTMGW